MSYQQPDLRITEVAALLSVSIQTVYDMLADGRLQSYQLGRRSRRVTRESVDRLRSNISKPLSVSPIRGVGR